MNGETKKIEAQGMGPTEIRELVAEASGVIAHYWPMSTFVHHNPLHNLESLHFEEAVRLGRRYVGGNGYLHNAVYRAYVETGRITDDHIDQALRSLATDQDVRLGEHSISHFDVLYHHLMYGESAPAEDTLKAHIGRSSNKDTLLQLVEKLSDTSSQKLSNDEFLGRDVTLSQWCDLALQTDVTAVVNNEIIKWCEAFLDEGHAAWAMPEREKGFFHAWKELAALEWSPCGIKNSRQKIRQLPHSPEAALLVLLDDLKIPEEKRQQYLSHHLASLCGWASFINWRGELSEEHEWQTAFPIDLTQYLAVRLWYERELVHQTCKSELGIQGVYSAIASWLDNQQTAERVQEAHRFARQKAAVCLAELVESLGLNVGILADAAPESLYKLLNWIDQFPLTEHGPIWLKAFEAGYQEDLLEKLSASTEGYAQRTENESRPDAQAFFCIDVRSEPLRRNIEAVGNYETIGFAGFFTVFIRHQALGDNHSTEQYPAIGKAQHNTCEVVRAGQQEAHKRYQAGRGLIHLLREIVYDLKSHTLTPYITVESLGWLYSVPLFGRTLFPRSFRRLREKFIGKVVPSVGTNVTVDTMQSDNGVAFGFKLEEQVSMLETALRSVGLTKNFARIVAACGHGSSSDNNPYEAALNCGACGGNAGTPNARVFAAIANKPEVRKELGNRGIVIPDDTHFVAGLHNTTTDSVTFFDEVDIPETHHADMERFREHLQIAAHKTNEERYARLPLITENPTARQIEHEIDRRAGDWSEVRPEWGLSGNAAFIIGRRCMTDGVDLDGRAFLNNYDYREDTTGALLQGILGAPCVVGQWINSEHYFSATDPEVYGAGSKIYHNVVGRIGIMSGPQSDLRTGLARQSVMTSTLPYHEPLRLLVVAEAPCERIITALNNLPHVQALFDNEWMHLVASDPEKEFAFFRYRSGGAWSREC